MVFYISGWTAQNTKDNFGMLVVLASFAGGALGAGFGTVGFARTLGQTARDIGATLIVVVFGAAWLWAGLHLFG